MVPYRLAHLSPQQMSAIERVENEMGVTLVAYEGAAAGVRNQATEGATEPSDESLVDDALLDTYRTYDPEDD